MDRRAFMTALVGGLVTPVTVEGQVASRVFRVAMFAVAPPFSLVFLDRLRELGYTPDHNLLFELHAADMQIDRFPALAADLTSHHPDVIVAAGSQFVLDAVKSSARATPIVMVFIDFDPLASGQVASLSRPGGNITGLSVLQTDIAAKRLELLHEAVPSASRIGVVFDAATRGQHDVVQTAATALRVALLSQELRGSTYDYDGALRTIAGAKAQALLILSSGRFFVDRFALFAAIQKHRLPSMATTAFADNGALLCYGVHFPDVYVRAAEYVDRILKGQRPADLPIEQPTKLKFIVNTRTAKALGLTIPQSVLVRADQVIE